MTYHYTKHTLTGILAIGVLIFQVCAFSEKHSELKAFPAAKDGMERFVIVLPSKGQEQERNFTVELIPGKTMPTDGVNLVRLASTIEPRDLKGWGYTYYEVTGKGVTMSTLMAPAEGTPLAVEQFVAGTSLQVRYNSRLLIVIYAPAGYEIRYRIWSASDNIQQAEKG